MLIQIIREKFDQNMKKKYNLNQKIISNKNKLLYLYTIFNYSVVNKDIQTFLLFLYLHDTMNLDFKTKEYQNWKLIITSNLSYEVNKITNLDLHHYQDKISTLYDYKIMRYLQKNIFSNGYYFLIPNSWVKLNIKSLFRAYCRVFGKITLLYHKIIHNRYKPEGPGYIETLNNWKNNSQKLS